MSNTIMLKLKYDQPKLAVRFGVHDGSSTRVIELANGTGESFTGFKRGGGSGVFNVEYPLSYGELKSIQGKQSRVCSTSYASEIGDDLSIRLNITDWISADKLVEGIYAGLISYEVVGDSIELSFKREFFIS